MYLKPLTEVVLVHQETLMNNPTSWGTEDGHKPIIDGTPDDNDNYAKGHRFSLWEDDERNVW